jgi:hypothetical protein
VSLEEYTSGQFVIDDSNVLQTYDNRNITWTVVEIDEPVLDHPTATRKGLAMIGHFPNGGNFSLELWFVTGSSVTVSAAWVLIGEAANSTKT